MEGAERKLATMVFADLAGSTELAAGLDPEDLRAKLEPFFELAREALTGHGGTIEKYIGDAVMAVFGVPRAHGDDADRAVAAGLELARQVTERGGGSPSGSGSRPARCSRRSAAAISRSPAMQSTQPLGCRPQPRPVKCWSGSGPRDRRAWRDSSGVARSMPRAFPRRFRPGGRSEIGNEGEAGAATPFIGRHDELELLRIGYRRAVSQRVPGAGDDHRRGRDRQDQARQRAVRELSESEPRPRILLGRNPPYGRGIAFWALGEVLRSAAGVSADGLGGRGPARARQPTHRARRRRRRTACRRADHPARRREQRRRRGRPGAASARGAGSLRCLPPSVRL